MADFSTWTLEQVDEALEKLQLEHVGSTEAFETNKLFAEDDDHWQDGDGWIGPDGGSNTELRTLILGEAERIFCPRDAISECLDRQKNALIQNEPDITLVPLEGVEMSEAEIEKRSSQLKSQLTAWWDAQRFFRDVGNAVRRSRWAGRAPLRAWIPSGFLKTTKDEDGDTSTELPDAEDFEAALSYVQVMAPTPDVCGVYTDPDTQRKVAIFTYEEEDAGSTTRAAELWYVDEASGETVFRTVRHRKSEDEEVDAVETSHQLYGKLPIVEMEADLLITEAVRRQQRALNYAATMHTRVTETSGFRERHTTNAQKQGRWIKTPPTDGPPLDTQVVEGVRWYKVEVPPLLGPGYLNDMVGIEYQDSEGNTRHETPGITITDATDPQYTIGSEDHCHRRVLGSCKQKHIAMESTGEASGDAYEQARTDYSDDIWTVAGEMVDMIRLSLEGVVALADLIADTPEGRRVLDLFRISVVANPKTGPISNEMRRQNNADVAAGTLDHETAMVRSGVDDVDAAMRRLGVRKDQLERITQLHGEGVTFVTAAKLANIGDQDILDLFAEADVEADRSEAQRQSADDEIAAALRGDTPPKTTDDDE